MKNKTKRNLFQEYMDFIDRIVKWLCIGLMLFMLIVVLFQVISRKIPFIGSFSWTEELARYLMLWLVFLGSSHIANASSYIRVTFLVEKLSAKMQKVLNIITKVLILLTSGYFAWNCFMVFTTTAVREVSPAMQISMQIPRLSLVIGFTLVFFQALASGGLMLLPSEEEEEGV